MKSLIPLAAVTFAFVLTPAIPLIAQPAPAQPNQPTTQAAAGQPAQDGPPPVYQSDFEKGVDGNWSDRRRERAPAGPRFLGQFDNETLSLSLNQLPPHKLLRVTFDLYIINTWDGSGRESAGGGIAGPDFFNVRLVNGPVLMKSTFSNIPKNPGFADNAQWQTHPSPLPSNANRMGTGASAINALGYLYTFQNYDVGFPMDTSYRIELTFPHTANSARLEFSGENLQGVDDEGWGINNVKVQALPDTLTFTPQEQHTLWQTLLADDPVAARAAFWKLVAAGDQTVAFIQQQVPGFGLDINAINPLLDRLSRNLLDKDAINQLAAMGPAVQPVVESAAAENRRLRGPLMMLLRRIELTPLNDPARRQVGAAARLLYVINTDAARNAAERLRPLPAPATSAPSPTP